MDSVAPTKVTSLADRAVRAALFLSLVMLAVGVPKAPSIDLDSSWRMALSYFFQHGLQFGRDVVFTYGPLGFLMGRTYSGLQFNSLLAWQVIQGVIVAILIFRQGFRLTGYPRLFFFLFFFTIGVSYEDALHQMVIALAGFELLRTSERESGLRTALLVSLIAFLGLFKFTNLLLGLVFAAVIAGYQLWIGNRRAALRTAAWYVGIFLLGWVLCRQNPLNLPAYFRNSWEVSQGYQDAMGLPTPPAALWKGLLVLLLVIAYAFVFLFSQPDRGRAVATVIALGAYVYLNWKHGFVRADGHMIGFYYCVLMVATAFPRLLDDGVVRRHWSRLLVAAAGVLSLFGIETALPGVVRGALGGMQERFYTTYHAAAYWHDFRGYYDDALRVDETAYDLSNTREVVGNATVDVLGHEQGVAIYNHLNYHPRPVFQGYSAYTPALARMNFDFYASDDAPEYVLMKMHSIDRRFSTFDDSEVLHVLVQRYDYVLSEKGYYLWHRKAGHFDPSSITPRPLSSTEVPVGKSVPAGDLVTHPLWAQVDVQLSLLGRLRSFFYKPPIVNLRIEDSVGNRSDYRMPLPQGRTGFIINPIVEDMISYMRFAGAQPERRVRSLAVEIAPQDRDCFADTVRISYFALPESNAGQEFFRQAQRLRFHMFKTAPASFEAQTDVAEENIDGRPVMVLHAPSEMAFDVPEGATYVTGEFGFMPGAYTKGGNTDGAEFVIYCTVNGVQQVLFSRLMDPVHVLTDRGLQKFKVALPDHPIGRLYLRVNPGPRHNYSWDWTVWTGIEVK
ncbi:MAG TPA: hypothetical protein VHD32_05300 [Candidatus Didemnitutus sp.]|nr:hypothetical protein [Candidatus Didemnitutus sp.]